MQRHFEHKLSAEAEVNSKPQALWLALDALSGEVSIYSRAAATRLEAAYMNNRTNVPLAGLGDELEDAIIHLGMKGSNEQPVQRSLGGGLMDVRRLMVRPDADDIRVNVVCEHGWKIADVAVPGKTEERRVFLSGTEMVRPPSPPLPRLNPDRRASVTTLRPWWDDFVC
jgi:hypothetical protein